MSIALLHVDLKDLSQNAIDLGFWSNNPNEALQRSLPAGTLEPYLLQSDVDFYLNPGRRLEDLGKELYRWLDGGERLLHRALSKIVGHYQAVVLSISTSKKMGHLPWELLHDGAEYVINRSNLPLIPVRRVVPHSGPSTPPNRQLKALFMAASPKGSKELDFEKEEALILEAAGNRQSLLLTVEESGNLGELKKLLEYHGDNHFDLLHLTGHASHMNGHSFFHLETLEGELEKVTAENLANHLPYRPPLTFLSGCRTGQNPNYGEVRSFAERLVGNQFPAVLGWGRPVVDHEASQAARDIYQQLASGVPLALALLQTWKNLIRNQARDWSLLRLFCGRDPRDCLVTAPATRNRKWQIGKLAEAEFLDPVTRKSKVANRATFVGRRRLLQRALKELKTQDPVKVGLLLHGQGGRGKSSIAARLCDRLSPMFRRVVVIGRLDESSLILAMIDMVTKAFHDPNQLLIVRDGLFKTELPLKSRIQFFIVQLGDFGELPPLFVLDDFEQNQPGIEQGDLILSESAAETLESLIEAIRATSNGKVLITCRHVLTPPFDEPFHTEGVLPLDEKERIKQLRRLDEKAAPLDKGPVLESKVNLAADGNPRLFEWLHRVLKQGDLDHSAILEAMVVKQEEFRQDILARKLVESLDPEVKHFLERLLLFTEPIPREVAKILAPEWGESTLDNALKRGVDLGLIDIYQEESILHYRVPRQLAGGSPPILNHLNEEERKKWAGLALDFLYQKWWVEPSAPKEARSLALVRLASQKGDGEIVKRIARKLTGEWLNANRYRDTEELIREILEVSARDPLLLSHLGRALQMEGEGEKAGAFFDEAAKTRDQTDKETLGSVLFHQVDWLMRVGQKNEALSLLENRLLPLFGDCDKSREKAMVKSRIADIFQSQGEWEKALRIREDEELPVYRDLKDERSFAVTQGKIADILQSRGRWEEAMRIRQDKQLPVYEKIGDHRSVAVTKGKIADILRSRGNYEEALRIRQTEVLPVFENLGDVRSVAVTKGKIGDIHQLRGQWDEALKVRQTEELPVFEKLGDLREIAITKAKVADIHQFRGQLDEALRIRQEEVLAVFETLEDKHSIAFTWGKIGDIHKIRGQLDLAMGTYRTKVLPVFEKLKAVREIALTQGKIAEIHHARGKWDEALRICREEQIPIFEKLGDTREKALAMGRIVDIHLSQGELVEALRICEENLIPVFEGLNDIREVARAKGRIACILQIQGKRDEAIKIRSEEELPVYEKIGDLRCLAVGQYQLARLLMERGTQEDRPEIESLLRSAVQITSQLGILELKEMENKLN